jgi:hypothetical protein
MSGTIAGRPRTLLQALALFLLISWCTAAPTVFADDFIDPVLGKIHSSKINSTADAEKQTLQQLKEIEDAGEEVESVDLTYIGNVEPTELETVLLTLRAKGIPEDKINTYNATPKKLQEIADQYSEAAAKNLPMVFEELDFTFTPLLPADRKSLFSKIKESFSAEFFADIKEKTKARLRTFFGTAPEGVTFATFRRLYKPSKNGHTKSIDISTAVVRASITVWVMFKSNIAKNLEGANLNMFVPMLVAASFDWFFTFFQQGNSAFKGLGRTYDFKVKKFDVNRKFFILVSFIHSAIVRESIMISQNLHLNVPLFAESYFNGGFAGFAAEFLKVLSISATGTLGKLIFEVGLENYRRKNEGKVAASILMASWGIFMSTLQLLNQMNITKIYGYQVGDLLKNTLLVLGGIGLVFEGVRDRHLLSTSLKRIWYKFFPEKVCKAYLVYKTKPAASK